MNFIMKNKELVFTHPYLSLAFHQWMSFFSITVYSSPFSNLKSWCSVGSKSYIATTISSSSLPFSSTGGAGGGGLRWKQVNIITIPLCSIILPDSPLPSHHCKLEAESWSSSGLPGSKPQRPWEAARVCGRWLPGCYPWGWLTLQPHSCQ